MLRVFKGNDYEKWLKKLVNKLTNQDCMTLQYFQNSVDRGHEQSQLSSEKLLLKIPTGFGPILLKGRKMLLFDEFSLFEK